MATLSAYPNTNTNTNFLSPTDQSNHDRESIPPMQNHPSAEPDSDANPNFHSPLLDPPDLVPPAVAPSSLLHLSFNQDHGCFAAGTDHGFRIYNCDPFREIFRRDFDRGGGIGVVEMLFRCNILALVGGGPDPQYPPNKVMIWDDHQSRCISELSFRSEVRSVRLRRDRIIVVLEQKIFVYNFVDLKLLHQIETIANPKGLCAVSQGAGSLVLVCPGLQKGQVRVEHYASKRTKFIMAHDSRIACFALSQDGQLLATASTKGTLVRIYNTIDGSLLQEVRRGADRAEIYSLAFSSNAQWLAVSSDKGTVHVFSLKISAGSPGTTQSRSTSEPVAFEVIVFKNFLSNYDEHRNWFSAYWRLNQVLQAAKKLALEQTLTRLCVLPKYFSSEWSVAQFRLVEGSQYLVAFGHQKNTVVILGIDGSFYRCQFDPVNGGEMTQLEYHNFLKPEAAF
ncbi:hypothetical protein Godav_005520 [Gossypium davidsonii]|uniref:Autophagy-related protein 18a n=1 Tax=Gossypium davidsonii TaxID=34287 RepID=A0A7J8S1N6_GOSDV|nr:hypothetical protein [Gossypium davidsonii]